MATTQPRKSWLLSDHFPLVVAATAIIPPIVLWFLLIMPLAEEWKASQKELATMQTAVESKEKRVETLRAAQAMIAGISPSDTRKLDALLPRGKDLPGLLVELQSIAASQGLFMGTLEVNDFVPVPTDEALVSYLGALSIAVDWRGGTEQGYRALLAALERNARVLDVTSVRFTSGVGSIQTNLKAYYVRDAGLPTFDPQKLDTAFFSDPRFRALEVRSAAIDATPVGNDNPFRAP